MGGGVRFFGATDGLSHKNGHKRRVQKPELRKISRIGGTPFFPLTFFPFTFWQVAFRYGGVDPSVIVYPPFLLTFSRKFFGKPLYVEVPLYQKFSLIRVFLTLSNLGNEESNFDGTS